MKKILINLLLCFAFWHSFAENPVKKTIEFDGYEREYLLYTPENAREFDGLIVGLHGFNNSPDAFFGSLDLSAIADSLNYVIVAPKALPEQSQDVIKWANFLGDIQLNSVWGCGLTVTSSLLNIELNETIDDAGFLDTLIGTVLSEYAVNPKNLFLIGVSMGGYMAYQYALPYGHRLSGMVSIAGTMGTAIKGLEKPAPVPVCDFHSLSDEVVPYTGIGSYTLFPGVLYLPVTLGKPKSEVIDYWVSRNEAGEALVEDFPEGNGITVKKFTYPHPEHEVIHYQADGAKHAYVFAKADGDGMDYKEEIVKFFADHLVENNENSGIGKIDKQRLYFYSNPANNTVYFSDETGIFSVYDMTGRLLFSQSFYDRQADVSGLKSGVYIVRISSGGKTLTGKLLKN